MYWYWYWDWYYYVTVIPALLFVLWAQLRVNSTFRKYSNLHNNRKITGARAAQYVLSRSGVSGVRIERVSGSLTDHYDPRENVIRLSETVYDSTSAAAVGVACHEAGHAVQYAENYAPIRFRAALIPVTNFACRLVLPLFIISILLAPALPFAWYLSDVCLVVFFLSTLLQVVTLPVEFNASRRAVRAIEDQGLLHGEELEGAKRVLSAAAMTYVAALALSLMQLFRFLLHRNRYR